MHPDDIREARNQLLRFYRQNVLILKNTDAQLFIVDALDDMKSNIEAAEKRLAEDAPVPRAEYSRQNLKDVI